MPDSVGNFILAKKLPVKNIALLQEALTHSSWAYEQFAQGAADNERLEYLGDAVLQLSVSTALYHIEPPLPEGQMSKLRALLVCETTLARLARKLSLGDYLLLGHGEDMSGGREKDSNLSNSMEAIIAAIYLDSGFETAKAWILDLLEDDLQKALSGKLCYDYKSSLLEWGQAQPTHADIHFYIVHEEGPVHQRIFTSEVRLDGRAIASGRGSSKKEAEQAAAREALSILQEDAKP